MLKPLTLAPLVLAATATFALADAPKWPCLNAPTLPQGSDTPVFPGDTVLSDQPSFNCFAWKEFIAMTWSTLPGASAQTYGEPGEYLPVQFETLHTVADLMSPGDAKSAKFLPADLRPGSRVLSRTAKLGGNFNPSNDISEAAPFEGAAWLADRDGNLVWYEILVNDAEYSYFKENQFYLASKQFDAANSGTHIELPMGTVDNSNQGAVEIKAAWLAIPPEDIDNPKWNRYKVSFANFCSTVDGQTECSFSLVALVGMHILHKTTSQPSWTWATFDHVDNAPDQADVVAGTVPHDNFQFYRATGCQPMAVDASCTLSKAGVTTTTCLPNVSPAYQLGPFVGGNVAEDSQCKPYPIQVTRLFSLPETNENPIVQTNKAAHQMITAQNPDSVFQYYQLVNVMWSDSPVNENAGERVPTAPLSETAFRPNLSAFKVSNPMLETYAQNLSCVECHSGATIDTPPGISSNFASDYSFIFGMAH